MGEVIVLRPDEERLYQGQPKGFPFGDFALEDVMLPEDDDMGVDSDEEDINEEEIVTESGFGSVIVVDNLPVVPQEKYDKLVAVVRKIFSQIGGIREGGLWLPQDEEAKMTKGFAFIEYQSPELASAAREQTNGYKLDKSHTFAVNMFDEFDKYDRVPLEYEPYQKREYKPQENLVDWMVDKRGRDQFLVRHMEDTEIYWNDAQRSLAEEVYKRTNWTDLFMQWSPLGSYVTTVHRQGAAIWGGASFQRLARFGHSNVGITQFSPEERYLMTYSTVKPTNPREAASLVINIWDVKTGRKLRNFTGPPEEFSIGVPGATAGLWPHFKWAGGYGDRFFAHLGRNKISVYEAPEMTMLDRKSVRLEGVQDFQWSPSAPILCAYQSEQSGGNLPARICLLQMPERAELRQKNLFSVSEVQIYWHPQGDYLAVRVDRFTKTRKSTYTSFELFSVKDRDIPMEVLELPNKADKVLDFAWEPRGNRFAMLHGDGPRPSFSLYTMKDMKSSAKGVQRIGTQPDKQANSIHWSPQGKYLVLGGLKSMTGQLEFIGAEDMEVLAAAEHFMATDVEWDPTGRYVATFVTPIHQSENGFIVWSFNGEQIYRIAKEKMYQFAWRPRPPSLLSREREEDILKNLKRYTKKFEEEDASIMSQADKEIIEGRQRMMDEWRAWYESKREWLEWQREGRRDLLDAGAEEAEYMLEEVEVEEMLGGPVEEVIRP